MDRLRRSFRDSFRRRKEHVPESSKPHQWQADEAGVRAGTCNFHVKYLGCVEVFESRGMQVCEEALKVLRNSRRRPVKAILYVSGDGLRVVEDETKGLIVDQTIEKVSFCAPDRNHEKGFSYICRDGTTRRWMCHGFLALKESGERLSHAVGCAFAACLERKQKRDKECGVTMTFDPKNSTFTRTGSFRQTSITERLQDPQEVKPAAAVPNLGSVGPWESTSSTNGVQNSRGTEPPPVKPVFNPYAIERPHATVSMLQRQGSFRGFQQLNQASPFKRQMSLRISDLPSTLERQRSLSLEGSDFRLPPVHMKAPASPQPPPRIMRNRLQSLPNTAAATVLNMSPIPEASPLSDKGGDSVSAMCQQLSQGLSLLSSNDDFLTDTPKVTSSSTVASTNNVAKQLFSSPNSSQVLQVSTSSTGSSITSTVTTDPIKFNNNNNSIAAVSANPWTGNTGTVVPTSNTRTASPNVLNNRVPWSSPVLPPRSTPTPPLTSAGYTAGSTAPVTTVFASSELPRPEQWLGNIVTSTTRGGPNAGTPPLPPSPSPSPSPRRAPPLSQHLRAHSLGSAETFLMHRVSPSRQVNGMQQQSMWPSAHNANGQVPGVNDPFDAEWAAIAARNRQQAGLTANSTNPFITPNAVKTFEVHM